MGVGRRGAEPTLAVLRALLLRFVFRTQMTLNTERAFVVMYTHSPNRCIQPPFSLQPAFFRAIHVETAGRLLAFMNPGAFMAIKGYPSRYHTARHLSTSMTQRAGCKRTTLTAAATTTSITKCTTNFPNVASAPKQRDFRPHLWHRGG